MKRRTFIANTVAGISGLGSFGKLAFGQSPCPPQLTTAQDSITCPSSDKTLAEAAARLGTGQSIQFTKNTLQRRNDIQWSLRTIWHDPIRRELQYMGKPASSQSENYSHYIYSEDSDSWTTSGQSLFPGLGHIWDCTFDEENGDYWFHKYSENKLRWYDRSAESWKETISQNSPDLTAGSEPIFNAMGWHPNLFGASAPGIFIWTARRFFAFNIQTGQFSVLSPSDFASSSVYYDRNQGQAVYVPKTDQLVCFSRDNGQGHPAVIVEAGAGNSSDVVSDSMISLAGTPPIAVQGTAMGVNHGFVTPHPSDSSRLILLEERGTTRWWISSDQAMTWQLQSSPHPFVGMSNWTSGEFVVGTVSPYSVVIAMSSDSLGGETIIWKP